MPNDYPVGIGPSGGVCLGEDVICDGFQYSVPFRVQTHIHDDHMKGWPESKGYQDVFLSRATRALIEAEYNADVGVRTNLHDLEEGIWADAKDCKVQLLPSCHMLGAVQVNVELKCGTRVGYSGDFSWPMNSPIEVDALVLDSTNGSPEKVRKYREEEADQILLERLREKIKEGPIHLQAHRGTLHRALNLLSVEKDVPILATKKRLREIEVFRKFGYAIPGVFRVDSEEGFHAASSTHCVYLYSKGDRLPVDDIGNGFKIVLSAYMSLTDSPLAEYSARACRIALCDHADFDGCLEYVKSTGAKHVVVDMRGGHSLELAMEISKRLGISAKASMPNESREWGA